MSGWPSGVRGGENGAAACGCVRTTGAPSWASRRAIGVETSHATLIMDPWLSPTGAFDSSWFQFPRNHHLSAFVESKLQDAIDATGGWEVERQETRGGQVEPCRSS